MDQDLERKIRERAHRLWESDGRPEGREHDHWHEAERQIMNEAGMGEPGGEQPDLPQGDRPEPQPEIPADPLRNPELINPGEDLMRPATTGPEEMPGNQQPQPEIPSPPPVPEVPPPTPTPPGGPAGRRSSRSTGRKSAGVRA